jgi:branched-subunit amino acid permease
VNRFWLAVGYFGLIVGGGGIIEWYFLGANATHERSTLITAVLFASVGLALLTPRRRED